MKKTLIAIGLLSVFGTVHAASSVTLYGNINVAVTKKGSAGVKLAPQEYRYASHLGIRGEEDLGNGYSAIFKLEAQLEPDKGTGYYGSNQQQFGFNRHSYVGLVTPFGAFRFGRSTTPFVNMWVGGNYGEGRGVGEFTAGLVGSGLRTTQPEVGARWNNAVFYDIKKGGFAAGLAITTKGSESPVPTRIETLVASENVYSADGSTLLVPKGTTLAAATNPVNNEGVKGSKPAYGAYARYEGKSGLWGYKIGAAYQVDNGSSYSDSFNTKNAPAEAKNAWMGALGLSYGPASLSLGYAKTKIDNSSLPASGIVSGVPTAFALRKGNSKTIFASLGFDITSNDHVYVSYGNYKRHNEYQFNPLISGEGDIKGTQYSIGYEHRLSKRTVVYANARKVTNITNKCSANLRGSALPAASTFYKATCGRAIGTVDSVLQTEKGYSWDIGLSHTF
jgi:predicted porin